MAEQLRGAARQPAAKKARPLAQNGAGIPRTCINPTSTPNSARPIGTAAQPGWYANTRW